MINDYIALTLDPPEGVPKRSLWRAWNQLSRLQRSLIYLLICIILLVLLYGWIDLHVDEPSLELSFQSPVIAKGDLVSGKVEEKLEEPEIHHEEQVKVNNVIEEPGEKKPDYGGEQGKESNVLEEPKEKAVEQVKDSNVLEEPKEESKDEGNLARISDSRKMFPGPGNLRQREIVEAFKHAWKGYKTFAWGHDMLKPISKGYHDWFSLGLTIVDALDTMYIMRLEEEFQEARDWVEKSLHFDANKDVNLFEVTIRVVGGLLSAYHLSGDSMFLDKATDLGTRLLPCFDTESGVPLSDINLATQRAHSPKWSPDSSTSEVTTVQLEFRDLSRSTGDSRFEEAVARVSAHVHRLEKTEGLVPIFINAQTGDFRSYSTITLGARGDSYYEYLVKQWIQTGRTIDYLKEDYVTAMDGVRNLLLRRTLKNKLVFLGELITGGKDFKPKMDHLTCYLPGTLALGTLFGLPADHMVLAEQLLYTCYLTYAMQPTFLAPEISYFNLQDNVQADIYVKTNDAHNLLRPEFVESLWVMYQITGNTTYQEWGWSIFQAFEKFTKVPHGFTSIGNVKNVVNTRPKDMMESFFLGETLKYLYLLMSEPDQRAQLDLKKFVMNSEAHPLPIYTT